MPNQKVKLNRVREEEVGDKIPEGLKDGGHVLIPCSNCKALLADVWRTRPHEQETWKLQCSCPFCGDKSFVVEVQGGFHLGGVAQCVEGEPDEDKSVSTVVDPPDIAGDRFFFPVRKAHEHARPVHRL